MFFIFILLRFVDCALEHSYLFSNNFRVTLSASTVVIVTKMINTLPLEVVARIFEHLGFQSGVQLKGPRLWRNDDRSAAMALGLTCTTLRGVLAETVESIEMDSRYRFGIGGDRQVAALIAVFGRGLIRLSLANLKTVADLSTRAAIQYCPGLKQLYLKDLVAVPADGLADLIAARGSTLESLVLHSVYAGNRVLKIIASHCKSLTELRLIDLESEISNGPLHGALVAVAPTCKILQLSNLFGIGLSDKALPFQSDGTSWPVLTYLKLTDIVWHSDQGMLNTCMNLGTMGANMSYLRLSCRPGKLYPAISDQDVEVIRAIFPSFQRIDDCNYGFDLNAGIAGSAREAFQFLPSLAA